MLLVFLQGKGAGPAGMVSEQHHCDFQGSTESGLLGTNEPFSETAQLIRPQSLPLFLGFDLRNTGNMETNKITIYGEIHEVED